MVKINGKYQNVAGMLLIDYLVQENYDPKKIAVECNEEIVFKNQYDTFVLKENDTLEIVRFVGGG